MLLYICEHQESCIIREFELVLDKRHGFRYGPKSLLVGVLEYGFPIVLSILDIWL